MDNTSKDYYETVMRDFRTYGRGRSLEQFCRDEAIDYRWIEKAKGLYGDQPKDKSAKTAKKTKDKSPDMIQLHFEPDLAEAIGPEPEKMETAAPENKGTSPIQEWQIKSLKVLTPGGHEIEIRTSTPSAVSELLAKLTA